RMQTSVGDLPPPGDPGRDEGARLALRWARSELRVLDSERRGRRVRLIGPRQQSGGRVVRVLPISAAGARIGRMQILRRAGAAELGPSDERLLAIAAAQLGVTVERARFRKEALDTEVLRRADELKTELLHAVSHELRT